MLRHQKNRPIFDIPRGEDGGISNLEKPCLVFDRFLMVFLTISDCFWPDLSNFYQFLISRLSEAWRFLTHDWSDLIWVWANLWSRLIRILMGFNPHLSRHGKAWTAFTLGLSWVDWALEAGLTVCLIELENAELDWTKLVIRLDSIWEPEQIWLAVPKRLC